MLNYSKTQYCPTYIRIGADFLLLFSPWLLYSRRRCVTPYDASVYIALDGAVVSLRLRWHVQSMHNVQRRLVYRIFIGNTVGPCRWLYRRVEQQKRNIRLLLFYAVPCVRVVRCVPPFISLSVGSLSKPISALAREREKVITEQEERRTEVEDYRCFSAPYTQQAENWKGEIVTQICPCWSSGNASKLSRSSWKNTNIIRLSFSLGSRFLLLCDGAVWGRRCRWGKRPKTTTWLFFFLSLPFGSWKVRRKKSASYTCAPFSNETVRRDRD